MELSKGPIEGAQKVCLYGVEGIGKSTFAAKFPNAVFIDTEGSTKKLDVRRTPKPTSWTMLLEQVQYFKANPSICDTLIVDTGDWAEQLCKTHICAKANKGGIEDFGYGKGYTYLAEEFGRLLNLLSELVELGINAVIVCHAQMRKFEQPDEMGAYDRWELKLEKKVYPLVKEWADMVLFCNYKTYVVDADGQGTTKGTNKVQGGKRVMYTSHHPCWDAKNRHDLPEELPLDYNQIAHCITPRGSNQSINEPTKPESEPVQPQTEPPAQPDPEKEFNEWVNQPDQKTETTEITKTAQETSKLDPSIPKPLADLMKENHVAVEEIQKAVASRGYYPVDTPIDRYDPDFVAGVLVGAWPQVFAMIRQARG